AMFDILTYEKGASVLRMLEQHIGPTVFRDGVRQYLRTQRRPQILRISIAIGMGAEILSHPVTKHGGSYMLLQHPKDRCPFFICQDVKHRICILRGTHWVLDRSRTHQPVD
ncbi:MAG: hypothetical protein HP495_05225, partial [Nitrospira sp.]|nr:hypothetical protein [Nitrospira sp.]